MRFQKKRRVWLALTLLAALLAALLGGCSSGTGVEKNQFEVGDKVTSYWFDFTVDRVETAETYENYTAQEGCRLAVCRLTIKNTFDEDVPMGWADFILQWDSADDPEAGGTEGAYALPQYAEEQFPDEYILEKGAAREGVLVFEVPEQVSRAAIVFQELYADGESGSQYTEGGSYYVWAEL